MSLAPQSCPSLPSKSSVLYRTSHVHCRQVGLSYGLSPILSLTTDCPYRNSHVSHHTLCVRVSSMGWVGCPMYPLWDGWNVLGTPMCPIVHKCPSRPTVPHGTGRDSPCVPSYIRSLFQVSVPSHCPTWDRTGQS